MMNSTARKAEQERHATAGLDPELLETEARLRNALRDLGAHDPLRLSVGLAPLVHGWIAQEITPDEIRNLAPSSIPFQPAPTPRHISGTGPGTGCYMAGPGNKPNRSLICAPDCPVTYPPTNEAGDKGR